MEGKIEAGCDGGGEYALARSHARRILCVCLTESSGCRLQRGVTPRVLGSSMGASGGGDHLPC